MNCRRVQKLIPLHVEGDLPSRIANQVASHLDWCGRCNWLADEYKESQSWLRSFQPPEFDAACLEGLKRSVLNRMGESSASRSLLASLAQQWNRRQVLALSAAFVIVLGMVALYFYQARGKTNPDRIVEVVKQPPSQKPRTLNGTRREADAERASGASSSKPRHAANIRRDFRRLNRHSIIAARASKRQLVSQTSRTTEPATILSKQRGALPDTTHDSREMLRIEIQTGDPSIRIIWFAPKETDLHQPKPATD